MTPEMDFEEKEIDKNRFILLPVATIQEFDTMFKDSGQTHRKGRWFSTFTLS